MLAAAADWDRFRGPNGAGAMNPDDARGLKQGRVEGAVDSYAAAPIAAGGKIYLASRATPAIAEGRISIRTQPALYCFAGGK